jgi:hypothetical protein
MIPQGRITPATLQKRAEELAKLMAEFADMVKRVQPAETLIGGYSQTMTQYPSNSFRNRQEERPTQPLHQVPQQPSEHVEQLEAVSRGMANAVRRIRALEEENRLLREAQLATVQDVLALQESVRRLEQGNG